MPSFSQACAEAKISPIAAMIHCNKLGLKFEEFYPTMNDIAFGAIKALVTPSEIALTMENEKFTDAVNQSVIPKNIPRVLRKMKARNFWGNHTTTIQAVKTTFLKRVKNIDECLEWLFEKGFIAHGTGAMSGDNATISLVPSMTKEISALADLDPAQDD